MSEYWYKKEQVDEIGKLILFRNQKLLKTVYTLAIVSRVLERRRNDHSVRWYPLLG